MHESVCILDIFQAYWVSVAGWMQLRSAAEAHNLEALFFFLTHVILDVRRGVEQPGSSPGS